MGDRLISEVEEIILSDFGRAVIEGLSARHKAIPACYLYDLRGSQLFEDITFLPEYYPTRTETALLRGHAADLARITGRGSPIVEFGAGSATKTPLLIDAIGARTYVPIDISGEFLKQSVAELGKIQPNVCVLPVVGDFSQPIILPDLGGPLTGFFPGSTIGNFDPVRRSTYCARSGRCLATMPIW